MCGDFDDHERFDEELFERFIECAKEFGVQPKSGQDHAPAELQSEQQRGEYMQSLFQAGLTRCVDDAASLPLGARMDALAGQAIVFARLAGFLSAQFPPDADLFRTAISAFMDGQNEAVPAD